MLFTLLLVGSLAMTCPEFVANTVYSVPDAFECIYRHNDTYNFNHRALREIGQELRGYVYRDILLNPPQPSFDSNYHKKSDLFNNLRQIDLTTDKFYDFYQKLYSVIADCRDLHLSLSLSSGFEGHNYLVDSFYYSLPFDVILNDDKSVYFTIKNTKYKLTVDDILKKNVNVKVVKVNGKETLQFIREFGEKYGRMKSPHGNFVRAQSLITFSSLMSLPLEFDVLNTPIEIEYENGDKVTVKYEMIYVPYDYQSKSMKNVIERKLYGNDYSPLRIEDIENDFENENINENINENENENINENNAEMKVNNNDNKNDKNDKEMKVNNDKRQKKQLSGEYDYISTDGNYACKINNEKKMNVLIVNSFSFSEEDYESVKQTLEKCIAKFDDNDYPITVITSKNGGGYCDLGMNLAKVLYPPLDQTMIGSIRISEESKAVYENEYCNYMVDPETCDTRYNNDTKQFIGDWYTNPETVKYGDVEHIKSQESYNPSSDMFVAKLEKNPRKPTDIVVYTDGYCYSTCSMFTKALKEQGGAILVGYAGDPDADNNHFDVGQSPSTVVEAVTIGSENAKLLKDIGIRLRFSYMETYQWNYDYTETIPREFIVQPIDERSEILRFSEDKLDLFMDEANKIVAKYQNECNGENVRLVKIDDNCYDTEIEHAHGGYKCGSDNKWTNECVISYCDDGYKFDYINKKCIEDVCFPPEDDTLMYIVIGSVLGSVVLI